MLCDFHLHIRFIYFFSVFQGVSHCKKSLSNDYQLTFRLIKGLIFVTIFSIMVTIIAQPQMTIKDIIVCILALMPTGWGMLLVSNSFMLSLIDITLIL